eukprot:826856-Rhodomonas_salina.2
MPHRRDRQRLRLIPSHCQGRVSPLRSLLSLQTPVPHPVVIHPLFLTPPVRRSCSPIQSVFPCSTPTSSPELRSGVNMVGAQRRGVGPIVVYSVNIPRHAGLRDNSLVIPHTALNCIIQQSNMNHCHPWTRVVQSWPYTGF